MASMFLRQAEHLIDLRRCGPCELKNHGQLKKELRLTEDDRGYVVSQIPSQIICTRGERPHTYTQELPLTRS